MTADPRVEAVAEALAAEFAENEGVTAVEATSVALAALDAYDKEHPRVVWSEYEALIKDTVEADLRERIVRDLDHAWTVKSDAAGRHHDSYQEGYLDGIEHAASIVSRGTDPGATVRANATLVAESDHMSEDVRRLGQCMAMTCDIVTGLLDRLEAIENRPAVPDMAVHLGPPPPTRPSADDVWRRTGGIASVTVTNEED